MFRKPCNENYPGSAAASEVEVQAVQNLITKFQSQIKLYLSLQTFGQQILYPYNFNRYVRDRRAVQLLSFGLKIADKIRSVHGRRYRVGKGAWLMSNPESGTSSDYAYGAKKIPYAFTVKLPSGGSSGYEVPESKLDEILSESFEGFLLSARLVSKA